MHQMRYSTTCPSQFAWQYEWLWFNIGVLRAEYAHRSNLSKPDILQTSVWLNDKKKQLKTMAPTEQPIPLPQPMHTENSQRVFHSHSLPLQFYFCSSLIYINDFFFLIVFFILILPLASYQYAYWNFFFASCFCLRQLSSFLMFDKYVPCSYFVCMPCSQ